MKIILSIVLGLTLSGMTPPLLSKETSNISQTSQAKVQELEAQQKALASQIKQQLDDLPDSPKRQELKRLLAEIEKRMAQSKPATLYLSPSAKLTPEMAQYHAQMVRKIEDCGTRHFPKVKGKSVYGKGLVIVTLDLNGKVHNTHIAESSGKPMLDKYMAKVVRASSPFGVLPAQAHLDQLRPFEQLVYVTRFNFEHDPLPDDNVAVADRCVWR